MAFTKLMIKCVGNSMTPTHRKNSTKFIKFLSKAKLGSPIPISLVPEPENGHDRNAIGVYYGNDRIGYVSKEQTAEVRQKFKFQKQNLYSLSITHILKAKDGTTISIQFCYERDSK